MARPTLTPKSQSSKVVLPITGSPGHVSAVLPYTVYTASVEFLSGASDQVAYTYSKLGGDVLDIELSSSQVYTAYQEAVLEYSYIVNIHQAKSILPNILGEQTGTFDHEGRLRSGELSSSLDSGLVINGNSVHAEAGISLKYPDFQFTYSRNVGNNTSFEAGFGGTQNHYSASFDTVVGQQDYDLQTIISESSALSSSFPFFEKVKDRRIEVSKVFYKTPSAFWRFYGYYGGLNTVGNLQNYGQYADDSQFQIVPVWQNKLQAMAYEDAIYTRNSHWSYEIKNNKLRLFPDITRLAPSKMWVEFFIPNEKNAWDEDDGMEDGKSGVNNINTAPFANIPYETINGIGKQWIRRFALALSKEMLGLIRSKFATLPIPGDSVTLNGPDLISQAKTEQEALREELKQILDDTTYDKLMETKSATMDSVNNIQTKIPLPIMTA